MKVPENLKYTEDHEWIKLNDDGTALIGITDFAQSELGDIVYIEVDADEGELKAGDVFGSIEAVKTVSDMFLPISGEILTFNEDVEGNPELVNKDPYGKGWIIKLKLSDNDELDNLLNAETYKALIE